MNTLLAVNGTLMRGLDLNGNLLAVGASFVREARTAPHYRLWSIGDRHPAMLRTPQPSPLCEESIPSTARWPWKPAP